MGPSFVILIIVIAVVIFVWWAQKTRAKKAKDTRLESGASVKCKICGQDNPPEARFCGNCGATLVTAVEPPSSAAATAVAVEYMGFWRRFGAAIIDGIITWFISLVLTGFTYGPAPVGASGIVLPLLYYWLFTGLKGQTPGKMVLGIKVVNSRGERPGLGVAAMREVLGKLISAIALCLGFLWIAWDKEKQGWHDKIAGTHVVKVVKAKSTE